MHATIAEPLLAAGLSILLIATLAGILVLTVLNLRTPRTAALAAAAGLLVVATIVAAISPVDVPILVSVVIAMLGLAVAVLGGNPATRVVLGLATGGRVRETADGGILIGAPRLHPGSEELEPLLRGGTTIGYLERVAVSMGIIAGFPEAIAVVVAIKGIGRFSELAAAEARERFIVGTFSSLVWAAVAGALVRLAIW
ncbi:hypothetical protein [Microbacterium sp.]|uniref:hypothetical protein n=1 Tax=Microbacterium sp. TaxID=51671 RepID=UPI003736E51D